NAADVHSDCQLRMPSLMAINSALDRNRPANTASATRQVAELRGLRSVTVQSGTANMVRLANGKSRERASNTRPSAVSVAARIATDRTDPKISTGQDRARPPRGPNRSTKAGSGCPVITAL